MYSIAAENDTTSGRVHRPYHITTIMYPRGMFRLFPVDPPPKETTLCNPQSPSMKISSKTADQGLWFLGWQWGNMGVVVQYGATLTEQQWNQDGKWAFTQGAAGVETGPYDHAQWISTPWRYAV